MRSHLGGYGFATLTVLAAYAGMGWVALGCATATALTWPKRRPRRR